MLQAGLTPLTSRVSEQTTKHYTLMAGTCIFITLVYSNVFYFNFIYFMKAVCFIHSQVHFLGPTSTRHCGESCIAWGNNSRSWLGLNSARQGMLPSHASCAQHYTTNDHFAMVTTLTICSAIPKKGTSNLSTYLINGTTDIFLQMLLNYKYMYITVMALQWKLILLLTLTLLWSVNCNPK